MKTPGAASCPAAILAFVLGSLPVLAQEGTWSETRFDRVTLRNGNVIDGHLLEQTETGVTLKVAGGTVTLKAESISRIEKIKVRTWNEKLEEVKVLPVEPKKETRKEETKRPDRTPRPNPTKTKRKTPPPDVPAAVRSAIDGAFSRWKAGQLSGTPPDIADDLVRAGVEGGPYLRWIVEGSGEPSVPLESICRALARLEQEKSLDFLAKVLEFKESRDRRAGVTGLALVEKKEAIPLLVHALEDQSGSGWQIAMGALYELGAKLGESARIVEDIGALMRHAKNKLGLAQTLATFGGDTGHGIVLDLLRQEDEESLTSALVTLPEWGRSEDAPAVRPFLTHSDSGVRREACNAAAKLKDKGAVGTLIGLLRDENAGVQGNAHSALKKLTNLPLDPDPELWEKWWEGGGKNQFKEGS